MQVKIVGPNLPRQAKATFHIHTANCADLQRGWIRYYAERETWIFDADTRIEVCDVTYPPEDFNCESGEYLDTEFYFAPCCDDLPEGSPDNPNPR